MSEPRWPSRRAIELLHAESLAEHGGLEGLRDEGLLESALARPRNLHAYEREADIFRLAAVYAVGMIRNHPFVDGNKRAGFLAMSLFLGLNGLRLAADQPSATAAMTAVAAGQLNEEELARWLRRVTAERIQGS